MNPWTGGRLVELDESECWELLAGQVIGRIAYDDGRGPVVVPLNYRLHPVCIQVRTAPHSTLGQRIEGQRVAFEVDQVDPTHQTGWSVLVRGHAHRADVLLHDDYDGPEPWPAGNRPLVVEIDVEQVSGRRLMPT